jgi:hypothetical protein
LEPLLEWSNIQVGAAAHALHGCLQLVVVLVAVVPGA